jgi:AcrR family transcriptional regulator
MRVSRTLSTEEIEARRHAARRREIADRILPAVEALLAQSPGFANLSVEDLLRASGLARSTFYRYFKDKNEMLLAVSEPVIEEIWELTMRPWELIPDVTLPKLERVLLEITQAYAKHMPLLDALTEISAYDPQARQRFQEAFEHILDGVAAHIRRGQDEGLIRPSLHPAETAGWITWMGERGMSRMAPGADEATLGRLATSIAELIWNGVYDDDYRKETDGHARNREP